MTAGSSVSQSITASGGTSPYTYAITSGALPQGLNLSSNGALSGTPTTAGAYSFTITATDSSTGAGPYTGSCSYSGTINVEPPTAADYSAATSSGATTVIDLMPDASGGPFTAANIVAVSPIHAGTAVINDVGTVDAPSFQMSFTAAHTFYGTAVISYTLNSAHTVSSPANVTINISARPNMANDPEVKGLISAAANTIRQFATTHIANFTRRLEALHNDGWAPDQFNIRLNSAPTAYRELSSLEKMRWQTGDEAMTGISLQDKLYRVGWVVQNTKPSKQPSQNNQTNLLNEFQLVNAQIADLAEPNSKIQQPLSVWIAGTIDFGQQYSNGQQAGFKFTTNGISVGGDYRVNDLFTLGLGIGFSRDSTDIANNGTKNITKGMVGALYSSLRPFKNFFIDSVLGYAALDFDSTRYITDSGGFATSTRKGNQIFGALVTGYEYRYTDWLIAPYGRLEIMSATLDQTTETASNLSALTYFKQTVKASNGTLGLRVEDKYITRAGILMPYARVEFLHRFEGANSATLAYADLASVGPIYSLDVLELSTGNWMAGIGARMAMRKGLMFTIDYTTNINQTNGQSQTILLGINIPIH